jgi:glycosyltransferase involved in cell wall biosynthesis
MQYLINTVSTSWKEPPRARHQVARTLAKKNEVIFVARNEVGKQRLDIDKQSESLTVITPYFPVDYRVRYRFPLLNEYYQNWLFKILNSTLSIKEDIRVINFDFTAIRIHKHFRDIIYYCSDDPLMQVNKDILFLPYYAYCEKKIMKLSRFTVVVSDYLLKSKASAKTFLIYLGADDSSFNLCERKSASSTNKKSVVLNYMGFIDSYRMETDWIRRIAHEYPMWEIDLVGPIDKQSLKIVEGIENINLCGPQYGEKLVETMSRCTVAIIPFKNNRRMITCSANNKYWQYLALGKPVVYRKLPYLLDVPEYLMYKAETYEEFKQKILDAINDDNDVFIKNRKEFALNNTWDRRVEELLNIYEKIQ